MKDQITRSSEMTKTAYQLLGAIKGREAIKKSRGPQVTLVPCASHLLGGTKLISSFFLIFSPLKVPNPT